MQKRQFILFVLLTLAIFYSFTSSHFLSKYLPLDEGRFSLDTRKMSSRQNKLPAFFLKKNEVYFIHPSTKVPAKGTFKFKDTQNLFLHFSIQEGSKVGKILFSVKVNGEELHKILVMSGHDAKITVKIKQKDTMTIIADSNGSVAGDWGNLKILKYESSYILKQRLIPVLWIVFFVFLMSKNYFFIALNSYFGFLLTLFAEKLTFGAISFMNAFVYSTLFFLFAFFFILLYQEFRRVKKFKIASSITLIITILIYAIPTAFIVFRLVFEKSLDWNMLYAVYQTNFDEALAFTETFIPLYYFIGMLIFIFIFAYIFWRQEMKERKIIDYSLLIFLALFLGILVSVRILELRLPYLIYSTYEDYTKEIEYLKRFQEKRKASKIKFSAKKKEKGEIYVVVIGESLNKYNMSLYDYFNNTTPRLLKQKQEHNLKVFNNVYSNAGNTMRALSFALTEANQYNHKNYFESLSFIDIFNKAGFDTYWLTTQSLGGDTNTLISVIADSSKHIMRLASNMSVNIGTSSYYDENNIAELKKDIVKNESKNKLFVIHVMGSHFHYNDRYPKKYDIYQKSSPFVLGTKNKRILGDYHAYDNSVYYNDYVMNSLLDIVQKHGGVSAFLYFADHSEDIAHHRGHTARLESFTFPMFEIPMMAWLSPAYIKRYPDTYKVLTSHTNKLFSNDMIYETLIGLAHIKTDHYKSIFDLCSKHYRLDAKNAMALHGNIHYTDRKNFFYWQKFNTKILKDNNISSKIVIANTDSVGKLEDIWRLGYRSFKLNLFYIDTKKSFQTGTDKYDTGGDVADLLGYFDVEKIKHIFLNLNNVSKDNVDIVSNILDELDQKLSIKKKSTLIVTQEKLVNTLQEKGWKVALDTQPMQVNSNADYFLSSDIKSNSDISKFYIFEHALNLADSKLDKGLKKKLEFFNKNNVKYLLVDFKSEYQ